MAMVVILLRAVHILGGIFWTGAAMLLYWFVMPSAAATRPDSARFMQHLTGSSRLTAWMTISSIASVVAGIALFAPISGSFEPGWMHSTRGIVLSVGALLGLGAALEGQFLTGPTARKLGVLAQQVSASNAGPTAEQTRAMGELQAKLARTGTRGAWLLGFAAALMAAARYI